MPTGMSLPSFGSATSRGYRADHIAFVSTTREESTLRPALLGLICTALALSAAPCSAQGPPGVFLEDYTWQELREAIAAGATTVLVVSGSVEESGPHLALGKHNFRARVYAERIARALSNTYSSWETMAGIRRRWNLLPLVSTPSFGRMEFASSSSGTVMRSPRRKSRHSPRAGTSWARGMVVYGIRRSSGLWHPQRSGFRCSRSETRLGRGPWTRGELRVTRELPHPNSVASSGRSGSATRSLKSVPCWRPSPLPRE